MITTENIWSLSFTVHGEAQAWQRPVRSGGKTFTPGATIAYETQVMWSAKNIMTRSCVKMTLLPVNIDITFYFVPPKSWTKAERAAALANTDACLTPGDTDNYIKSVLDGLNRVAYKDDHLVIDIVARKRWAEKPRADVILALWRPLP